MAAKLFHILRSQQFSRDWLEKEFFPLSTKMKKAVLSRKRLNDLDGKTAAVLFYEPSTRTRTSFQQAVLKLGGQVIATENAKEFSSAIKGETIKDTTRIMNAYHFDVVIMRTDYEGAADEAAEVSTCPIINAGDGAGQHPTQSLLDIYTIYERFGKVDGLRVAFVGDLKYGRTVRSLCYLLGKFKVSQIDFVAPDSLQMREDILEYLKEHGVKYEMYSDIKEVASKADVFYMTRAQKERMKEGEKFSPDGYRITQELLKKIPAKSIIMHPLPRSNDFNEIPEELTDDSRIVIFEQAENGLFTRMALLKMVIG